LDAQIWALKADSLTRTLIVTVTVNKPTASFFVTHISLWRFAARK